MEDEFETALINARAAARCIHNKLIIDFFFVRRALRGGGNPPFTLSLISLRRRIVPLFIFTTKPAFSPPKAHSV